MTSSSAARADAELPRRIRRPVVVLALIGYPIAAFSWTLAQSWLGVPPPAAGIAGMIIALASVVAMWRVYEFRSQLAQAPDARLDERQIQIRDRAYLEYEVSRNPMYTGWSATDLGLAAIRRDAWLLAGWLLATGAVHREVLEEEARLSRHFGAAYSAYRRTVPRYLPIKLGLRTARDPRQARLRRGPRGPAQRPASARSKSR